MKSQEIDKLTMAAEDFNISVTKEMGEKKITFITLSTKAIICTLTK